MNAFNLAIVSPTDAKAIAGILTVYAKNEADAMKRVRKDPDMEGVRCYPLNHQRLTEH